ncbi:MAG: hypothetical protein U0271_12335 [Polyangiaceae bacterium]
MPTLEQSLRLASALAAGVFLSACGSTVITPPDDTTPDPDPCGVAGCDSCPTEEPSLGDDCTGLPDFQECKYSHEPSEECTYIYSCEPVYPEAGAPSVWVDGGTEGGGCECNFPSCGPGESTFADYGSCAESGQYDCRTLDGCGETIACGIPICDLAPACDPGDTLAGGTCPPDALCYTVEYCGDFAYCFDDALPQHGCPYTEPTGNVPCANTAVTECDYPSADNCVNFYFCDDSGFWVFAGGGCGTP